MRRFELAERVIELRERVGLTQGEAAKRAGVGVTTWSNIETGTITRPHARTVIKIARALGVEPEELTAPKAPTPQPDPEEAVEVIHIKGEVSERTRRKPWSLTVTHTWGLEDVLEDVEAGRTEEAASKLRELIGSTA